MWGPEASPQALSSLLSLLRHPFPWHRPSALGRVLWQQPKLSPATLISRGLLCSDLPLPPATPSHSQGSLTNQLKTRSLLKNYQKTGITKQRKKARKGEGRKKEPHCVHPTPTLPSFSADSLSQRDPQSIAQSGRKRLPPSRLTLFPVRRARGFPAP